MFYIASAGAMNRGIDGVDNQAGLLIIPMLWIMAILVLIVLNVFTLIYGLKIKRNQKIDYWGLFRLSGLTVKEKVSRMVFITITCLLMLFGYSLFTAEKIWAISYALSGGVLLLFLYAWGMTPMRNGQTTD